MPALSARVSKHDEAIALYTDPDTYAMAVLASLLLGHGPDHRRFGPDLTMWFQDIEARVYGNRMKVEKANQDAQLWQRKRRMVTKMTGSDLLEPTPPSQDSVRKWRERLVHVPARGACPEGFYDTLPTNLAVLHDQFVQLAAARAKEVGQFPTGRPRDFTRADRVHTIIADGTYVKPFSQVREHTDYQGGTKLIGSRAESAETARLQPVWTNVKKDNRSFMGINHIVAVTETPYGRVALGIVRTLGGEPLAAAQLTEAICQAAGDGVHVLLYDKGISTWPQEYLMAHHAVAVITPRLKFSKYDPETESINDEVARMIKATQSPRAKMPGLAVTTALAADVLNDRYQVEELIARHQGGEAIGAGLVLGTSQYVNSAKRIEQYTSVFEAYGTHTHDVNGTGCDHELYVDDGALWEVTEQTQGKVKVQRLTCTRATAERNGTHFDKVLDHQLVCHSTGEVLHLHDRFTPRADMEAPGDKERRARRKGPAKVRALAALQGLATCDPGWRASYGRRNAIESWFEFLQQRFLDGKRGASMDPNHQFLDIMHTAAISNALVLRRHRQHH